MEKIPMTAAGHAALGAELKRRTAEERPRIIEPIAEARSHGDLSENAEYHAAKEAHGHNEGRIAELEDRLSRAEIIDVSKLMGSQHHQVRRDGDAVDEDTDEKKMYQIVGDVEADVKDGRISICSPIARALIGKGKGDTVEVTAPGGSRSYESSGRQVRVGAVKSCSADGVGARPSSRKSRRRGRRPVPVRGTVSGPPEVALLKSAPPARSWSADDERGAHAVDMGRAGELFDDEGLEGSKVARDAFEDEVDFAGEHVALANAFRPSPCLEGDEVGFAWPVRPTRAKAVRSKSSVFSSSRAR